MKKAFDQTVRDLKRGVNKKVLKVPGIEQKVLDSTSNESWGPHGELLADIAQATKNYHEYQMIMHVLWKRINDTGKNWRHVYKALSVLEYLVVHGSDRVIDDIREHAHQISTLSDFQYIDSSGRDQGSNIRKKAQSLVALVNDKERIQEVRQKGVANRDKYRTTSSTSSRHGAYSDHYDDDHHMSCVAGRDEDQYGHEKEREMRYRDDGRSRGVGPYGREGDRNGGYSDEHYGRDGYRDDSFKGSHGNDDYQYGSRNRSHNRNRSSDDDDRYSSRSGGGRVNDLPGEERQPDHRLSVESNGAPPSYGEATRDSQNHVQEDRSRDDCIEAVPRSSSSSAPKASSPSESTNQGSSPFAPTDSSPSYSTNQGLGHASAGVPSPINTNNINGFNEFDPRVSISAAPPAASSLEKDIFGLASASDPMYSLAAITNGTEVDHPSNSGLETDSMAMSSAYGVFTQPGENPFGDPTFIATQENSYSQGESFAPVTPLNSSSFIGGAEVHPPAAPKMETSTDFDFDLHFGITYNPSLDGQQSSFSIPAKLTPEAPMPQPNNDISGMCSPQIGSAAFGPTQQVQPAGSTHLQGNVLPQSGPSAPSRLQGHFFPHSGPTPHTQGNFLPQSGPLAPSHIHGTYLPESGPLAPSYIQGSFLPWSGPPAPSHGQGNFLPQSGPPAPSHIQGSFPSQSDPPALAYIQGDFLSQSGPPALSRVQGNLLPQSGQPAPFASQATQLGPPGLSHLQGNPLPQSGQPALFASQATQLGPPAPSHVQGNPLPQSGQLAPFASQATQLGPSAPSHVQGNPRPQSGQPAPFASQATHLGPPAPSHVQGNPLPQSGQPAPFASQATHLGPPAPSHVQGNPLPQSGQPAPFASQATQLGPPAPSHVQGNTLSRSGQPTPFTSQATQLGPPAPSHIQQGNPLPQSGQPAPFASQATHLGLAARSHVQGNPPPQSGQPAQFASQASQIGPPALSHVQGNLLPQPGQPAPFVSQATHLGQPAPSHVQRNLLTQSGVAAPFASQATQFTSQDVRHITPINNQTTQLNLLSQPAPQAPSTIEVSTPAPALPLVETASTQKFEPKSRVWADTLSRGLVNLNISGPKTNPHADIGVDFDSINRKEKREERKVSAAPVSTITMGKAMGTGSGIGRTGASAMAAPPNPMMGPRMGMGMGMMGGSGMGMGMMSGGAGGMGMGMMGAGGYGGNMGLRPMGMGMNMGMNQGMPSRPPMGFPPGSGGTPGVGYNPMMGMGNYGPQQPYGGSGYR